jgi:hypothetical protein
MEQQQLSDCAYEDRLGSCEVQIEGQGCARCCALLFAVATLWLELSMRGSVGGGWLLSPPPPPHFAQAGNATGPGH